MKIHIVAVNKKTCKIKMKLNENGSKTLSEVLSQSDGPFSKTLNVMLALELMEKGTELASNQVTKLHLANIIKALCAHLEWTEEIWEQDKIENEISEDSNEEPIENTHTVTNILNT